ncbi:DinB family protein [Edaphobacter sp. 12200R-103]|uniref:DinB family protein n=1 Tax=Edaphobacter sp. 12200R-103 TaxID=2703788 RepID=UPI00138CD71C|nr:DinB family protein [Edaphobacter sp. 12200R-103]QHS50568.1 DinB family protein [Edaphobacter sp. 12200R-103]
MAQERVEPWLRGTLTDVDAVRRAVLHALELAAEDVARWCDGLNGEQMEERPLGLPTVGFHLRHIARSLDRLLTYAENQQLSERQLMLLKTEDKAVDREATLMELAEAIEVSTKRVLSFSEKSYDQPRFVGRKKLPTTVGGLLIHCADHTQRHVGQAITTAKFVIASRER